MKQKNETVLMLFILATSSALTFWKFQEIPYTHDELSAVARVRFDNFSDLIKTGVMPDSHPAGVQVFLYYYSKFFGTSEPVFKFPFALAGIFSLVLVFLIGKKWFNSTVGLTASAWLAALQYMIMYNQVARPYSTGLFFTLLMVYFWSNIVFQPQEKFTRNAIGFVLSAALCAYNHYFSLLFAAIVGLSGLFFVQRNFLLKYLLCGICIFLLYIPHLPVFYYQLKLGGPGIWLGKPGSDFLPRYFNYVFQHSALSYILMAAIILFGFYKFRKENFRLRFFMTSLLWFILPFFIGYFYSETVKPILQKSALIFGFPYLFFALFGHLKEQGKTVNTILVTLILAVNTYLLIFERKHHEIFYQSPFEEILLDHITAANSGLKTLSVINTNTEFSEFYVKKYSIEKPFTGYEIFKTEADFIRFMEEVKDKYDAVFYGCVSVMNPVIIPIIREYFPYEKWSKNYSPGDSHFFTKGENNTEIISLLDFESEKENWRLPEKKNVSDSLFVSGKHAYFMGKNNEWSPDYTGRFSKINPEKNDFIDVSISVYSSGNMSNVMIVSEIKQDNNKVIEWKATRFSDFIHPEDTVKKWRKVFHSIKLQDVSMNGKTATLSIYVWNEGRREFYMDDFTLRLRKGNPIIYALYEKF